ncbi:MAG: hypothetical protein ACRD2O_03200, partial [Terriglobia bacterium]
PVVRLVKQDAGATGAVIHFEAASNEAPLDGAEYSTDGRHWIAMTSDDGMVDSRQEAFTIRLPQLGPGEHVISLRVHDTAGNVGLGKSVVRIPGAISTSK